MEAGADSFAQQEQLNEFNKQLGSKQREMQELQFKLKSAVLLNTQMKTDLDRIAQERDDKVELLQGMGDELSQSALNLDQKSKEYASLSLQLTGEIKSLKEHDEVKYSIANRNYNELEQKYNGLIEQNAQRQKDLQVAMSHNEGLLAQINAMTPPQNEGESQTLVHLKQVQLQLQGQLDHSAQLENTIQQLSHTNDTMQGEMVSVLNARAFANPILNQYHLVEIVQDMFKQNGIALSNDAYTTNDFGDVIAKLQQLPAEYKQSNLEAIRKATSALQKLSDHRISFMEMEGVRTKYTTLEQSLNEKQMEIDEARQTINSIGYHVQTGTSLGDTIADMVAQSKVQLEAGGMTDVQAELSNQVSSLRTERDGAKVKARRYKTKSKALAENEKQLQSQLGESEKVQAEMIGEIDRLDNLHKDLVKSSHKENDLLRRQIISLQLKPVPAAPKITNSDEVSMVKSHLASQKRNTNQLRNQLTSVQDQLRATQTMQYKQQERTNMLQRQEEQTQFELDRPNVFTKKQIATHDNVFTKPARVKVTQFREVQPAARQQQQYAQSFYQSEAPQLTRLIDDDGYKPIKDTSLRREVEESKRGRNVFGEQNSGREESKVQRWVD